MIGESQASGVSFPDYVKVAEAYGVRASRVCELATLPRVFRRPWLPPARIFAR